jgi:hypothetical protein
VGPGRGRLAGIVTTPAGAPLPDARILVAAIKPGQPTRKDAVNRPGSPILTDRDGRFVIADLPDGRHALWATHPDFADAHLPNVAVGTGDLRIAMPPPSSLAGRLVDRGGQPVVDFELIVAPAGPGDRPEADHEAVTRRMNRDRPRLIIHDEEGRFRIERLAPGAYELTATSSRRGLVAQLPRIEVGLGTNRSDLRLVAEPGLTARGRIVDGGGRPMRNAEVAVLALDGYRRERTNADGTFALTGLPRSRNVRLSIHALDQSFAAFVVEGSTPPGGQIDFGDVAAKAAPQLGAATASAQ